MTTIRRVLAFATGARGPSTRAPPLGRVLSQTSTGNAVGFESAVASRRPQRIVALRAHVHCDRHTVDLDGGQFESGGSYA
jgi:hypothetical protein